jgi:hypothetical protein
MESDEIVSQYGLGRIHEPDSRDCDYLARERLTASDHSQRSTSKYFKCGPQLDQGQLPRCIGFGGRDMLAASPQMLKKHDPTPETLYFGAQDNDDWPGRDYDGSSVRGLAKFMQQQGLIKGDYLWAFDAKTVLDWILTGKGPVIFGTSWYRSMFSPNKKGIVTEISGPNDGGHCYLAYGANEKTGLVAFQNSWGSGWGLKGKFFLPIALVDRLIKEDGEALMSIEPVTA